MALALLGRKEEAYLHLEQIHRRAEEDPHVTMYSDLVCCYAALGDMDNAFYYLNIAYEKHAGSIFFVIRYPINTFLKKDERYWILLERMGLKKYYEERNE